MSAYTDRVARSLEGLEAVSTGLCPGCETCRRDNWDYRVREFDEGGPEPFWSFDASAKPNRPGILHAYATEDEAEAGAKQAFDDDWRGGRLDSELSFRHSGCGICHSGLGGDFEVWHAVIDGEIHHWNDACVDCVQYLANGTVPDESAEVRP